MCIQQRLRSAWVSIQSDQESSLCTVSVSKDPMFLHADSKDSDQTGWMLSLARRTSFCWFCHAVAHTDVTGFSVNILRSIMPYDTKQGAAEYQLGTPNINPSKALSQSGKSSTGLTRLFVLPVCLSLGISQHYFRM